MKSDKAELAKSVLGRAGWPWFRRAEQALWAACLAALLVAAGVCLAHRMWLSKRLIDIDTVPRREAEFAVDLNRADWPELAVLPGISETFARRIVEFRSRVGRFSSVEQLQDVPGIGAKTVGRLRPFLFVDAETGRSAGEQGLAADQRMR